MSTRRYKYGELNSVDTDQSGMYLDPEYYSAMDMVSITAEQARTPKVIQNLGSPIKGICLRVESFPGQVGYTEGYASTIYSKNDKKPNLVQIRARIPEIHSYIPDPKTYGPEGDSKTIQMYPIFTAISEDLKVPSPGEIVFLDFGDRNEFNDPIYLGTMEGQPSHGGYGKTTLSACGGKSLDPSKNKLGVSAPQGDTIGSGTKNVESQVPKIKNRPEQKGKVGNKPNPSISNNDADAWLNGENIGPISLSIWKNPPGGRFPRRRVSTAMLPSLKLMNEAMKREIGWELYVNSGFRTYEEQKKKYEEYLENGGDKVAKPGESKHQSGRAVDLSVIKDGNRRSLRGNKEIYNWLIKNGHRFNFAWGEVQSEEWHWSYTGNIPGVEDDYYVTRLLALHEQKRNTIA